MTGPSIAQILTWSITAPCNCALGNYVYFTPNKNQMSRFFIDNNIARAKTLDTLFYKSPEIFEESKEKIFRKSWQFMGEKIRSGNLDNAFLSRYWKNISTNH